MTKPWLCESCGEHMFWHGLRDGRPICPEGDAERTARDVIANEMQAENERLEAIRTDIQKLVQENERLKDDLRRVLSIYDFAAQDQRIKELEAERDAIRAETIKECVALAGDRAETWHTEARRMAARDLRDAIRAFAQTDEANIRQGDYAGP